jgi:hypothetical protein
MNKLMIMVMVIVLSGCASVARIGEIGVHEVYMVQTCDMISPCTTTILTHNPKDGALNKIEGGTGPSALGQFLGPASVATAGYFVGKGLGESGDVVTSSTELSSESQGSQAGAVSAAKGGNAGAVSGSLSGAVSKAGASSSIGSGWVPPGHR